MSAPEPSVPPLNSTAKSWNDASQNYATRVGRMCSHTVDHLVQKAHFTHPFATHSSHVLDIGTGTSAVPSSIITSFPGTPILATYIASGMLTKVSTKNFPNVKILVLDANHISTQLAPSTSHFTHAFSTFMLMFTTTPLTAKFNTLHSVLSPDALIGLALWGPRIGPSTLWEQACQKIDPTYILPSPFADPHAWRTCSEVEAALRSVGFQDVSAELFVVPFKFENTESYLDFWYGSENPVSDRFCESWKGDERALREALEGLLRERYDDARGIKVDTVVVVGRK